MPKVITGVNPIAILKDNKNYMLVPNGRWFCGVALDDYGYINVHTGCVIFPVVMQPKFFGKEFEYTGSIWVCWNQTNEHKHDIFFDGTSVQEFLEKINT